MSQADMFATGNAPLPFSGKFQVLESDCPWSYDVWSDQESRTADAHYPVMTIEDLCDMGPQVRQIADTNCALFHWVTPPLMKEGIQVIEAWGFRHVTTAFDWWKLARTPLDEVGVADARARGFPIIEYRGRWYRPFFGLGHYTRGCSEQCLLGIRGSMPVTEKGIGQTIIAPAREHSRKPDERYPLIERLYPDACKIELFARQQWPGWSVWGNQINKFSAGGS